MSTVRIYRATLSADNLVKTAGLAFDSLYFACLCVVFTWYTWGHQTMLEDSLGSVVVNLIILDRVGVARAHQELHPLREIVRHLARICDMCVCGVVACCVGHPESRRDRRDSVQLPRHMCARRPKEPCSRSQPPRLSLDTTKSSLIIRLHCSCQQFILNDPVLVSSPFGVPQQKRSPHKGLLSETGTRFVMVNYPAPG